MIITLTDEMPGGTGLGDEIRELFSKTGKLSRSPDFEYRPQQQEMATRVARALEEERPLIIEAGTGVGKSLAYLVPSARFALANRRKAVISTHTINLQEQLVEKDIPIARKIIGEDFSAVLLKGRGNYLCPERLKRAMNQSDDLFSSSDHAELRELWEWSTETQDGSLSDLDFTPTPRVWAQVCSEAHVCNQRTCGRGRRCFYQNVRKRAAEADVIVLNHTLFFTFLASAEESWGEGRGFLFPDDFVILDEGHTLENVAARQLGMHLSHSGMRFDLQRLYNPRSRKGYFSKLRHQAGVREVADALDAVDEFFDDIERACTFRDGGGEFRVRHPDLVENRLSEAVLAVRREVLSAAELITSEEGMKPEILEVARKLGEMRAGIASFLDQSAEDQVYWVEKRGGKESFSDGGRSLSLHAAPVDVASLLSQILFTGDKACVVTSATLGTGDDELTYFRRRVGAGEAEACRIGSPFDYRSQMVVHLVKSIPAPSEKGYEDALERWIGHFLKKSEGRAFVLFTSYRLLRDMAERLERFCDRHGWTLLAQGSGMPRRQLIREFREDIHSVLFGTESFWTGVDVPGKALSNVIVTRLPFAVPDHPLTAARLEEIEHRGGNPFMEYSVPEAILKLRQGVGRLIRSTRDEGIAVILDNRIMTKQYGRAFLNALPDCNTVIEEGQPEQ